MTNTWTIYVHGRKKYNLVVRAVETSSKGEPLWRVLLSSFAASANKFDIFKQYTYIDVYLLKCPKTQNNWQIVSKDLKRIETSVVLIVFHGVHNFQIVQICRNKRRSRRFSLWGLRLYCYPFLHESGTRRTRSLSVTVSKKLSNQCNLTAQIE